MKKNLILMAALLLCITASAQNTIVPIHADVNGDGAVDVADIGTVISTMTGSLEIPRSKADVNGDGAVDVADIATVIDIMAAGGVYADRTPEGVEAIDLGLPSGTMWANMNVGATKPEDYGLYFAWAETEGYTSDPEIDRVFTWETYKWMIKGGTSEYGISKYQMEDNNAQGCWFDKDGFFIGDGELDLALEDDAVYVHWGGHWQFPTVREIRELINYTTFQWVQQEGVYGQVLTSTINGNSIFLPAAGLRNDEWLLGEELGGIYWTKTILSTPRIRALCFYSDEVIVKHNARYNGITIRPVIKKSDYIH